MKRTLSSFGALAVIAALSMAVYAAITIDDNGIGFVGKGDVQLAFGWNNAQLQQNAGDVVFRYASTSTLITERTWTCQNNNNQNTQVRERTTTTTSDLSSVLNSVARVRNQITGFNLNGFGSDYNNTTNSETDGPPLNSCPGGPWFLSSPAGDPQVVSSSSSRQLIMIFNGTTVAVDLE